MPDLFWKACLTLQEALAILVLESRLYIKQHVLQVVPQMTIANRVKELRTSRGWTQEELAAAVGVSRQSINSIERERYVPSLPLAMLLARAFECPFDELFQLEEV